MPRGGRAAKSVSAPTSAWCFANGGNGKSRSIWAHRRRWRTKPAILAAHQRLTHDRRQSAGLRRQVRTALRQCKAELRPIMAASSTMRSLAGSQFMRWLGKNTGSTAWKGRPTGTRSVQGVPVHAEREHEKKSGDRSPHSVSLFPRSAWEHKTSDAPRRWGGSCTAAPGRCGAGVQLLPQRSRRPGKAVLQGRGASEECVSTQSVGTRGKAARRCCAWCPRRTPKKRVSAVNSRDSASASADSWASSWPTDCSSTTLPCPSNTAAWSSAGGGLRRRAATRGVRPRSRDRPR